LVDTFSVNAILVLSLGYFLISLPKRFLNSGFLNLDFLGCYRRETSASARWSARRSIPVPANPDSQFQQACPAICAGAVPSTRPSGDGNEIADLVSTKVLVFTVTTRTPRNDKGGTMASEIVVGFIGLGTMGGKMATNILKAGYKVVVHDLHRQSAGHHVQAGAEWADTPRALAERSDVIFTSLPEPADVERVALGADGLIEGVKSGAAYFDLSTNSQSTVKKIHEAFAARGAHMLDAPVSGGPSGAASRKMAIWVGGDKAAYEQYKSVLDAMGDRASYIGAIGTATVAKLVHNMSGYAITCALAETFAMGVKAGMDPVALWEAVRQGVVGRRLTFDGLLDQFLPGSYDPPSFALKLATKDVALATALGRELGVPMRICNLAYAEMTEACNRGWQGRDSRAVMLLEQERAGVNIAADPEQVKQAAERAKSG
jgi:3-hydroxyisobutyrate dehydrogenase-like beta-hydroxyacid dehydrogenase